MGPSEKFREQLAEVRNLPNVLRASMKARGKNKDQFFLYVILDVEPEYGLEPETVKRQFDQQIDKIFKPVFGGRGPFLTSGSWALGDFTYRLNPDY